MPAPKLHTPEGLSAIINATIHAAKNPDMGVDPDGFNWHEILIDFQVYNCVAFGKWYSGMDVEKVSAAFERWLKENPEKLEEPKAAPVKCKVVGCLRSAGAFGYCFEHEL